MSKLEEVAPNLGPVLRPKSKNLLNCTSEPYTKLSSLREPPQREISCLPSSGPIVGPADGYFSLFLIRSSHPSNPGLGFNGVLIDLCQHLETYPNYQNMQKISTEIASLSQILHPCRRFTMPLNHNPIPQSASLSAFSREYKGVFLSAAVDSSSFDSKPRRIVALRQMQLFLARS